MQKNTRTDVLIIAFLFLAFLLGTCYYHHMGQIGHGITVMPGED